MKVLIIVVAFFFISFLLFSLLGAYARNISQQESSTPTPTVTVIPTSLPQ